MWINTVGIIAEEQQQTNKKKPSSIYVHIYIQCVRDFRFHFFLCVHHPLFLLFFILVIFHGFDDHLIIDATQQVENNDRAIEYIYVTATYGAEIDVYHNQFLFRHSSIY